MSKNVFLDYKDLPEWVKTEIYNVSRSKPRVRLHVVEDGMVSVSGPAYDYSKRYLVARNGKGEYKRVSSGYYDAYLNHTATERAVYEGGKIAVPDDGAIISVDTHAKVPDLYVTPAHPLASLARRLPAGDKLDEVERMVLEYYVGLNSRGRKDAIWRYGIPERLIDMYTQALARMELVKVNKRGAVTVTTKGHNVCGATPAPWSWYSFSSDNALRNRVVAEARAYAEKEA